MPAHIPRFREHVPLDRLIQLRPFRSRWQAESLQVQRIEVEKVPMGAMALGRAWAAVAGFSEIILATQTNASRFIALRQVVHLGWNIVEEPVIPVPCGRVRIVHHEREATGASGRAAPFERR